MGSIGYEKLFDLTDPSVLWIIELKDAHCIRRKVIHLHDLVSFRHNDERIGHGRRSVVVFHHETRAVGGRYKRFTPHVVVCDVQFVFCEIVTQIEHTLTRILGIFAGRKSLDQLPEGFERLQRQARVPLGWVEGQKLVDETSTLFELRQSLQVVGIVNVGVLRVQFDKSIGCRNRRSGFIFLVVCVGRLDLGLSGVGTERVARFKLLIKAQRILVTTFVKGRLARIVKALRRPAEGRIGFFCKESATGKDDGTK